MTSRGGRAAATARQRVQLVEKETGVPVDVVSVGEGRDATLLRRNVLR